MRKIAIVFPGVGYNKDRPLLYYSGKLAKQYGYELVHLDFSGLDWSKEALKDAAFMRKVTAYCLEKTDKMLESYGDMKNDRVVFISKSIGTVVANAYASQKGLYATQICFSPLSNIEEYVKEEGAFLFCGVSDPYADFRMIEKIADEKRLTMVPIPGGNHSLETGDILTDIQKMQEIIGIVAEILDDGNKKV